MTSELHGARVLVTGASGFIGSRVCQALRDRGAQVIALTHGDSLSPLHDAEVHPVDLTNAVAIRTTVRQASPTHVVHLAAVRLDGTNPQDLNLSYAVNLIGTLDLAEAIIDCGGCQRFVYLSSAEEYGRASVPFDPVAREMPLTAYGVSKLAATQLLQALSVTRDLPIAVLRATVVYGPGQQPPMFVPSLVRALVGGEKFPMTEGEQLRDFVYVDDVVNGILRALVMSGRHDTALHLSAGAPIAIRDVALLAARLVGGQSESLIGFGAVPHRSGEAREYWASSETTRNVLGWLPRVSLTEGLERTIAYARAALMDG